MRIYKLSYFLPLFVLLPLHFHAQGYVVRTFKDTRIINTQAVDILQKRKLDVRIGHRFGDLAGDAGGWPSFYGLENAADVLIGADYGLANNITIGAYRSKGGGALSQLVTGSAKVRLLKQRMQSPSFFTVTALGTLTASTMQKSDNPEAINFFEKQSHRFSYTVQLLIGKKFSDRFSLQISPGFTHRNIAPFGDVNDIYTVGAATRLQLSKVVGLILDATIPLNGERNPFSKSENSEFQFPLGVGFEFDTGGHIFQVNLTNARGMIESDYITNTTSDWMEGEFRLGFTISRLFNIR
ncbi:MAG: DUF5777 family beta-barrel protein [Bacteroidota bacterium]